MTGLLIRDLDPEVVDRLKLHAKQHHRSLQSELKHIITEAACKMSVMEAQAISRKWHNRLAGHPFTDSADLLREDRDK